MFKLAHISDIHLAPLPSPRPTELIGKRGLGYINWLRKRRSIHRADVLASIVADLKAQKPDHIAVTGDLINLSLSNEFAPARAWLEGLAAPDLASFVPGNHDAYVRATAANAARDWGDYMRGDGGDGFPYVRRRGHVALVGVSTARPTLPLAATGRIGAEQLARLGDTLAALGREEAFRIVMIHHPPIAGVNRFRRLDDAEAFRETLRAHGAELVLHGHLHETSLAWLAGPYASIACIGTASASGAPEGHDDPASYNLIEVEGEPHAWHCTLIVRGMSHGDRTIGEIDRRVLTD